MTISELRRVGGEVPPRWRLLFEFMAHTGMRIGEVSELRWGRDVVLTGRPHVKLRWRFADDLICEPKKRYAKRDIPLSPGWCASSRPRSRSTPTASSYSHLLAGPD